APRHALTDVGRHAARDGDGAPPEGEGAGGTAADAGVAEAACEVWELFDQLARRGDVAHQGGDLVRDRGDRLALDAPGAAPDEVDLQRLVELGVVGAVVAAARLPALAGGLQRRARRERGRLEVEGVGEVVEAGEVRVYADVGDAGFDRIQRGQPGEEALLVAHHAGVLRHDVADRALQGPDVLGPIGGEQLVDLRACRG